MRRILSWPIAGMLCFAAIGARATDQPPPPGKPADPPPTSEGQVSAQKPCNTPLDCPSDLKPGRGGGMLPDGLRPIEGFGGIHLDRRMDLRQP